MLRQIIHAIDQIFRWIGIILIRGYRYLLSPLLGSRCRFYPSCSRYAETAIKRFGLLKGSFLTLCRLSRCHPWHPGGVDQVPTN